MFPVKLFSRVRGMTWNISTEKITSSAVRHCYRFHFHILQNSSSAFSRFFLLCEWIWKCYQRWLWCCVLILMKLLQEQQLVLVSPVGIWAESPHSANTASKHLSVLQSAKVRHHFTWLQKLLEVKYIAEDNLLGSRGVWLLSGQHFCWARLEILLAAPRPHACPDVLVPISLGAAVPAHSIVAPLDLVFHKCLLM